MLFIPFAGKKDFWACIKDLEQHYWYMNCSSLIVYFPISLSIIAFAMLYVMQGVGPSLAISFSVYESLRSYWQLQR